jgi:chromosome segregation protein
LPPYEAPPALPEGVESLGAHVTAPPVLSRRLGQIGVVPDADTAERLRERLRPGQRLVSRDGALWRWDGLTRAAGTPTSAGQRLRQRNRLAEISEQLAAAARAVAETSGVLEAARAEVMTASAAARDARSAVQDSVRLLAVMRERQSVFAQRQSETDTRLASLKDNSRI